MFLNKLVLFKETFPNLLSCFNLSLNPSSHSNGLRATTCSWSKGAMVEGCMQRWNKTIHVALDKVKHIWDPVSPQRVPNHDPFAKKTTFSLECVFWKVCKNPGARFNGVLWLFMTWFYDLIYHPDSRFGSLGSVDKAMRSKRIWLTTGDQSTLQFWTFIDW